MSEYSTKELIYFLEGSYAETPPGMMEIVYAKLRAADKLCEAAKVTLDYLDDHFWENANIDESMAGERILTPLEKELKKAIADYEGEGGKP